MLVMKSHLLRRIAILTVFLTLGCGGRSAVALAQDVTPVLISEHGANSPDARTRFTIRPIVAMNRSRAERTFVAPRRAIAADGGVGLPVANHKIGPVQDAMAEAGFREELELEV